MYARITPSPEGEVDCSVGDPASNCGREKHSRDPSERGVSVQDPWSGARVTPVDDS